MSHPYPPPRDKKGSRIGFTTGANAAAAAKAAAIAELAGAGTRLPPARRRAATATTGSR